MTPDSPLTDAFGRHHTYLRISVTERCNLRCTYCMPPEGVVLTGREHILTFEEIERLAALFVGLGVDKIRLTGGEPLVRKDVDQLIARIGRLPGLRTLALTTNGLLLPGRVNDLRNRGVNLLNISLDTLRSDRFEAITRRKGMNAVVGSIYEAIEAGYDPVKVNCVVMRGVNDDELFDFAAWTRDLPLEIRFIEYMPFEGNGWTDRYFVPASEQLQSLRERYPDLERLDDGPNLTARTWRIPGHRGSLGFISSMSDDFCGTCNRLRITADGSLKVCLFGNSEVSLRDAMRKGATDDQLVDIIAGAVLRKKAAHAGMYELAVMDNRSMIRIGG